MGKEFHYVYKLTNPNSGEFYYGSRTCKCNPADDTYMGSMVSWKVDKSKLVKELINTNFETRKDALEYEAKLITENIKHPLNRNYNIPGNEFCNTGKTFTDEHIDKLRKSHLGKSLSKEHRVKISKANIGRILTENTKLKISNAISGITRTDETKLKISIKLKEIFSNKTNHPFYGKNLTDIHKNNLRNSKKNKCKPVIQFDVNGNFVNEYMSTSMASNQTKISKVDIRRVCNGKRSTAGGYKWKYK
jgi:hypothetical protein